MIAVSPWERRVRLFESQPSSEFLSELGPRRPRSWPREVRADAVWQALSGAWRCTCRAGQAGGFRRVLGTGTPGSCCTRPVYGANLEIPRCAGCRRRRKHCNPAGFSPRRAGTLKSTIRTGKTLATLRSAACDPAASERRAEPARKLPYECDWRSVCRPR